jgi:2-dehydropantoate 2-reductase
MRILIVGAGGVGGYFGGRLVEAGGDVTFLVRPERAQQLANQGLVIESPLGDSRQSVATILSVDEIKKPDIIFVACKAYGLEGALSAISQCVGKSTVILPLLNGIAHLEYIERQLPQATVWGGIAHLGVTLGLDGAVRHLNNLHTLMFGTRPGNPQSRRTAELADGLLSVLAASSVDGQRRPEIEQDLWDKFIFLSALAASTCLMRASIGTILATPHGERLILQLLDEATRVAEAEGFAPDTEQMARYRGLLTERGSPSTASMLRDIELGQPTEAEHILGDIVARAHTHAIAAPTLEIALTHLQAYEHRRTGELNSTQGV